MSAIAREELLPGLWRLTDTCNVYLLCEGDSALAVDFGSGRWLSQLPELGIRRLEKVLLTHHHADQCHGLGQPAASSLEVHAPVGEERFFSTQRTADCAPAPWFEIGCPPSYAPPPVPLPNVQCDLAGNCGLWWRGRRIRCIHTPGHGPNACSIVADHDGRQVVFCGDAAHAGATVRQPFHLEWDHWTGQGALAAWEGIVRLMGIAIDLLCPSHGPVVTDKPGAMLEELANRLLEFYHVKGQISPEEPDRLLTPRFLDCGALQYLPRLYQFGGNGYLLVSQTNEALVVDPFMADMPALEALLAELPGIQPSALAVTHYHYDHCDAITHLRERYGARAWLHPAVAEMLREPLTAFRPWLHREPLHADALWPNEGTWQWHEYPFTIAHWPGQTWWHCAFMTEIDDRKVFFAGDSFVPASRWNGTGGFCAYNGSRFADGFIPSAQLVLNRQPQIMAGGHGNVYGFAPGKFTKIIEWAGRAEAAVRALCPSGDLEHDYHGAVAAVVRDPLWDCH